jgi:hypothetical protein
MRDEQKRMSEAGGFIEHHRLDVALEDGENADESHSQRHDHDKLADKAMSLGDPDAKLAVVHLRQAHESLKLALLRWFRCNCSA